MTDQEIEKLVQDKLNEAYKAEEHPHKFFITANGRGVTDGGDLGSMQNLVGFWIPHIRRTA